VVAHVASCAERRRPSDVGPIFRAEQLGIIERHVADAVARGARVLAGGRRNPSLKGLFYEPTVLVDVTHEMAIVREETFGPILPILRVRDEDEALRLANDSSYGLTASIWTRDGAKALRLARRMEAGSVCVNDAGVTYGALEAPFGGVKASGVGRVNGEEGLRAFCHANRHRRSLRAQTGIGLVPAHERDREDPSRRDSLAVGHAARALDQLAKSSQESPLQGRRFRHNLAWNSASGRRHARRPIRLGAGRRRLRCGGESRNRMRPHALLASLFTLALSAGPNGAAGEALDVDAAGQPRIVNGVTTHDYPTTGALLYGSSGGSARLQCSGTLIGCQTFLTAAHCVVDDSNPAHYFVYLQNLGVVSVTRVVPNDDYRTGATPDSGTFPIFDVAVLTLGAQVTGVDPTAINQTDPEPFIPHAATIVGYGQTLGGAGNYGIKRAGAVQTENCNPAFIPNGAGNDEVICWSYTNPVGPPGTDSNTCNGDSGGPLFMDLGSGVVLAGTTSGGTDGACNVGDHSYDANVFTL
jgi:hypothetical protein